MGIGIGSSWHLPLNPYWYRGFIHHYFTIGGGDTCTNWVADLSCCWPGDWMMQATLHQCGTGALFCISDPWASFKFVEISGPYDSEISCNASSPLPDTEPNLYTKNVSFVLAEDYNLFPASNGKFEMTIPKYGNSWGFFCDWKQNLKLHMKFDAAEVFTSR